MPRFARRPLTLIFCSLFAGLPLSHADESSTIQAAPPIDAGDLLQRNALTATFELAAADDPPVRLRTERKFDVIHAQKPVLEPVYGVIAPPVLLEKDEYPLFIIANEMEGRADDSTDAIGDVELRKTGTLIFADRVNYRPLEDDMDAHGHVRLIMNDAEMDTPHLRMKLSEQIGFAEQADFKIIKEVKSRFYQQNQIVVTSAASNNSSSAGAPMMLNIPDSYGLPTTIQASRISEGYGTAERINFEGPNQFRLLDANYSSCKPGQSDWYLQGSEIKLDYDQNVGNAEHASVWFKDVPLLYMPTASFALNHQRRSGFLHPSFSTSTKSGFSLDLPYYVDLAPNYDVLLHPRIMTKRGFQLGAEARFMDAYSNGTAKLEYMPEDAITHQQRYGYNIQHTHYLGRGVGVTLNLNRVSDDLYNQDMSSRLLQTSQVQLPQHVVVNYSPSAWLQSNIQVLRYQTLQPDPNSTVARPYFIEPQINLLGFRPDVMNTDLSLIGQYSRFTHTSKIQGDRLVLYPQVSLPIVHPAFQITPKFGVHMTKYSLSNAERFANNNMNAAPSESISRTLPTFSLDATVTFERDMQLLDMDYIQTLEPRLYYVHIPYKDQSKMPNFDSGLSDFNFAQIFAENRYSGFDKINDANQLTAAVTSRILDASTGVERFKVMLGQRYYFKPQQVTLDGLGSETVRNANFSNLIAGATGLVLPKTYADGALEYDYKNDQLQRLSMGARYQPDYGKVLSASYRYTRDALTTHSLVDQLDFAGQWPLGARWYAVGRYNYSMRDKHALETIAGLEYNAGCWAARLVAQRLEATTGTPNTSLFFQLELNDFGSIGANPIQLLRRTIPGYGKSNELPNSGSLLTTE